MNRLRFHTASGSVYGVDLDSLRWTRLSEHDILGAAGVNGGRLTVKPTIVIGGRAILDDSVVGPISTTPVVLIEDVSIEAYDRSGEEAVA